eukprot:jgi/Mesvir1/10254/Mv08574-RA.1
MMSEFLIGLLVIASAVLIFHIANNRHNVSPESSPDTPVVSSDATDALGVLVPPARPTRPPHRSDAEVAADEYHNTRQRNVLMAQLQVLDVPREILLSTILVKRPDEFGRLKDVDEISEAQCKLPESEVARRLRGKVSKSYRLGPFHVVFDDTDSTFSVLQLIPENAYPNPSIIPMPSIKYSSVPRQTYSRAHIDALMTNLRRQASPTATNKECVVSRGDIALALFESVDARVVDNKVRGTVTKRKLYVFRTGEGY